VINNTFWSFEITVVTRKFYEPIFSGIDAIHVHHADVDNTHKGFFGLIRLFRDLKEQNIDLVADLHNVLRSNVLKLLFTLRGTKVAQIDKGRQEKKALTRSANKVFAQLKSTHQRYADVFAALGYPIDIGVNDFVKKQNLTKALEQITCDIKTKWIGIAPFAQYQGKTYPWDLMVKVIQELDKSNAYHIFLFGGGQKEQITLEALENENITNLVGKFSFEDELKLISNLHAMISMDSGNAHLAAMYGVPTVTLWGVTHPFAGFAPYAQPLERAILPDLEKYNKIPTSIYGNKFPSGYEQVMRTIAPKMVVQAIQQLNQ